MSNYQEAKKIEGKKAPAAPKAQTKSETQKAVLCPNCNAAIPEEAIFCPECGFSLNAPIFCPNCGMETTPDADICQACGAWLLDGQCMFCYARLDPNAEFCADCGNPKDGIQCPGCGTLSIFDFCTKCGKALTEGAALAIELAKSAPDAKRLMDSVQQTIIIENELAELEALINSTPDIDDSFIETPAPPPVKKSFFSESQLSAINKSAENMEGQIQRREEAAKRTQAFERVQEEERQRSQAAAARKQEKLELITRKDMLEQQRAKAKADAEEALRQLQSKTFLNQQEARRFHNAMKTLGLSVSGWLCNTYGTLHTDGPNGCANPNGGGRWV